MLLGNQEHVHGGDAHLQASEDGDEVRFWQFLVPRILFSGYKVSTES